MRIWLDLQKRDAKSVQGTGGGTRLLQTEASHALHMWNASSTNWWGMSSTPLSLEVLVCGARELCVGNEKFPPHASFSFQCVLHICERAF